MVSRYRCVLVSLLAVLVASCNGTPSRAKVAELLQQHPDLQSREQLSVMPREQCQWVHTSRQGEVYSYFCKEHFLRAFPKECTAVETGERLGLLKSSFRKVTEEAKSGKLNSLCAAAIRDAPSPYFTPSEFYVWDVSLTDNALALGVPKGGAFMNLSSGGAVEVTGLADNKDGTLLAEFIYTPLPTKIAEQLKLNPGSKFRGRALLKRFDDGWRIVDVQR
jgi:hypothetical protein